MNLFSNINQTPFIKRIEYVKSNTMSYISKHIPIFMFTTAITIFGLITGFIMYNLSSPETKAGLFKFIQNYFMGNVLIGITGKNIFITSLKQNMAMFSILFISGLWIFLSSIGYGRIFFKGASIGLTACMFCMRYTTKGICFIIPLCVLPNIIVLPTIILFTASSTILSAELHRFMKPIKKNKKLMLQAYIKFLQKYLVYSLFAVVALLAASLVQSFISPGITEIIYSIISSNA